MAVLEGVEVAADFNSQGAALAGLDVERRRRQGPDPVLYSAAWFAKEEADKKDANQARLEAAFKLVEDPADWKGPIDALIKSDELKSVYEAIVHFTACVPDVSYVGLSESYGNSPRFAPGDHILRIKAAGYRMGPAGDQ